MRIIWLNWRDIRNPEAGGAEVFTHEVARRLIEKKHQVNLFTSCFDGGSAVELVDGVQIIRKGNKYRVYNEARNYLKNHEGQYDLIIDEINTRPFMTTTYVQNVPVIALIHQLAREFWFHETPFPLNYFGFYLLENRWLKRYKETKTITISNSTKEDLLKLGFKDVSLIPQGLSISPQEIIGNKEECPTIVFIGRLKKSKLPDQAIIAFRKISTEIPRAKLWVIGDGYMRRELEKYRSSNITFFGHIDDSLKYTMLSRAHLLLVPAVREGWGLVVTEANAMGTPAVGYNVPGLRDSIRNGLTGLLTEHNSSEELAKCAISLLKNKALLEKFSKNALEDSRRYSWQNTTDIFEQVILGALS